MTSRRSSLSGTVLLLCGVAASGSAQTPAPATDPDSSTQLQDVIREGRKVFHGPGKCFACHGGKLQGGPVAPALTGSGHTDADTSFMEILHTIRSGTPHTPMAAHPGDIEDFQVIQVANYVWAVRHGKTRP